MSLCNVSKEGERGVGENFSLRHPLFRLFESQPTQREGNRGNKHGGGLIPRLSSLTLSAKCGLN